MPATPEPSRVYGYISLVDPGTGQEHLIMDNSFNPPMVNGYPDYVQVVFQAGANRTQVNFLSGDGLGWVGTPPRALLFNFILVQDRAETGNPRTVDEGLIRTPVPGLGDCEHRAYSIHYNPDLWSFAGVEVGPYIYSDPAGTITRSHTDSSGLLTVTGRYSAIPLSGRPVPFTDLPNIL